MFGFVIKTIFQLTFHNYVSVFTGTLSSFQPKNMPARLQEPHSPKCGCETKKKKERKKGKLIRIRWGHI